MDPLLAVPPASWVPSQVQDPPLQSLLAALSSAAESKVLMIKFPTAKQMLVEQASIKPSKAEGIQRLVIDRNDGCFEGCKSRIVSHTCLLFRHPVRARRSQHGRIHPRSACRMAE